MGKEIDISFIFILFTMHSHYFTFSYPGNDNEEPKKSYLNELKKVRFPYWDWASPSVLCLGIPLILFQVQVDVKILRMMNDKVVESTRTIRNPLRAYTLSENLGIL